jgi:hypothetical protein
MTNLSTLDVALTLADQTIARLKAQLTASERRAAALQARLDALDPERSPIAARLAKDGSPCSSGGGATTVDDVLAIAATLEAWATR